MRIVTLALVFFIFVSMVACSSGTVYAPVTEASSIDPIPHSGFYRVKNDDTLYSIAWRYGLDYRFLAKLNHIQPPYHIEPSQALYLHAKSRRKSPAKLFPQAASTIARVTEREPNERVADWQWPAHGPVIATFSEFNKGINIGGELGTPILATAAGKVVYSGHGLRAYGNLIIIKHNNVFLSAYAHNSLVLVKEGDWVKAGQKIAEMGNTGSKSVKLHFEIRRGGQPMNPLIYLAKKS